MPRREAMHSRPLAALCFAMTAAVAQPLSAQHDRAAYTSSVAAIRRRQAVDDSIAAPGARSILLAGGAPTARAIVLLHGLTDSPRQFEAFAYLLHADGNNVYVRIPSLIDRPLIGLADRLPAMTRRSPPDTARPDREVGFNLHAVAEILELGSSILGQAAREASRTREIVVLVNASDRTVKESAAEALARNWLQHGATVFVFELPDSLRLPHNIIDPMRGRVGGGRSA